MRPSPFLSPNTIPPTLLSTLIVRGIGEKTPPSSNTESGTLSPLSDDTLEDEVAALEAAAATNPEAMKTLVRTHTFFISVEKYSPGLTGNSQIALRDGDRCLLTGHGFSSALAPNCTHIIPFAIHTRVSTLVVSPIHNDFLNDR